MSDAVSPPPRGPGSCLSRPADSAPQQKPAADLSGPEMGKLKWGSSNG